MAQRCMLFLPTEEVLFIGGELRLGGLIGLFRLLLGGLGAEREMSR